MGEFRFPAALGPGSQVDFRSCPAPDRGSWISLKRGVFENPGPQALGNPFQNQSCMHLVGNIYNSSLQRPAPLLRSLVRCTVHSFFTTTCPGGRSLGLRLDQRTGIIACFPGCGCGRLDAIFGSSFIREVCKTSAHLSLRVGLLDHQPPCGRAHSVPMEPAGSEPSLLSPLSNQTGLLTSLVT